MNRLSPKTEIINHFDNLIQQVDIDIEQSNEKYNQDQLLGEMKCFRVENRKSWKCCALTLKYFQSNESSDVNEWSESTKVSDYLNQVRQRTIDVLRKAQEDSLESLKNKSIPDLDQLRDSNNVEEMKSLLFANKFYFQVLYKSQDSWVFNLYTIVADFYLSPTEINFLERLINYEEKEKEKKEKENPYSNSSLILDEKCVLIHSIAQHFCEKIKTEQYPSHVISFCKQDLLNIKSIQSYSSLFNVVQFRIEGLISLLVRLESIEESSFSYMYSLRHLELDVNSEINNDMSTKLFEVFPNIEELHLRGQFSNINFDGFANLKKLKLSGNLLNSFNFDVFKNICNQLEEINIDFDNMDDIDIYQLFNGHYFSNLSNLVIRSSRITRLGNLFDQFSMLQSLIVYQCKQLKTIDKNAFSNLKNLRKLALSFNKQLSEIDHKLFSCLVNLEELCLRKNNLRHFDLKIMDKIVNIKAINLYGNSFVNKEEIIDYFKESIIKLKI